MTSPAHPLEAAAPGSGPAEVPVENLTRWHASIADELRAAFEACLPIGKYTLGQQLAAFDHEPERDHHERGEEPAQDAERFSKVRG